MKMLNEYFPEWKTGGGIFDYLSELSVPWSESAALLNYQYHGNHSGQKYAAPIFDGIVSGAEITTEEKETLANVIWQMYGKNWVKEYATLSAEYNPIENYSMTESMTNDKTVIDYGRTATTTPDLTTTSNTGVYGFNSADAAPSETVTQTSTGTQSAISGGSDTTTHNYTLTRSGNIGVTTSQQMLESERQLWAWNFFESVVFPDIDRVLTLNIY